MMAIIEVSYMLSSAEKKIKINLRLQINDL